MKNYVNVDGNLLDIIALSECLISIEKATMNDRYDRSFAYKEDVNLFYKLGEVVDQCDNADILESFKILKGIDERGGLITGFLVKVFIPLIKRVQGVHEANLEDCLVLHIIAVFASINYEDCDLHNLRDLLKTLNVSDEILSGFWEPGAPYYLGHKGVGDLHGVDHVVLFNRETGKEVAAWAAFEGRVKRLRRDWAL